MLTIPSPKYKFGSNTQLELHNWRLVWFDQGAGTKGNKTPLLVQGKEQEYQRDSQCLHNLLE